MDSLVELQTYNTGPLLSFPAHPNVHPAGVPKVIPIPSELPVFTPGQGGLRKPRKVKAEGVSVPALQPKPVPALPMHMRENARYDILWMDADQGLSANSITSILEDSRGHLWFVAGDDGVIRYDGKRFTTFTAKEGLGTPGLYTILEDSKGNIWFGGIQGKVCRYDGRSFTHYGLDSVSTILCITEDKRGNIWFGTTHGGAVCYDGANFAYYSTAQGLSGYNVQAILEDSRGDIWLGTSNGLNRFDGMRFTRYTKSDGLISPLVLSIAEDNQGNLWFGSHLGVSCFDGKRFAQFTTEEGLAHNYVRRILKDSQGNIWFTSLQGGISRFDGATFTHYTTKEGLPNNSANGIWEDSGGNIWITAGGVSRLNPHSFVHFMEIDGKKTGGVQSLLKDQDGNIWFFKDNGERLVKYDGQFFSLPAYDNNFRPHYSLGEEMMEDYHGGLWFASQFASHYDGDIFTLYGAKSRDSRFQKFRCVLEGQQGNIWFGGVNGAFRFDGERMWQYDEKDGLPPSTIMSMLLDRHGKLWIGSESGITKYDGKNFTNYYDAESWGNFWAKTILEDSQSTLWFGGKQGVMRYDRKQATFYSTEDGLSHFYVNSIVEGQHQEMWIGTRQGLTLMVPNRTKVGSDSFSNKPSYRFYTFGKGDGLNEIFIFKAILGRHNRLWLGTAKGLSMLDLNQFELASKPPRILLEHIEANQQFIDYRQLADSAYLHSLAFGPALAARSTASYRSSTILFTRSCRIT
ncbi:MAG: hypothetical protein H6564_05150 [Lewinellaceae bacterium]|nr:hypothetical protein [Lewinellaceae bacterium]